MKISLVIFLGLISFLTSTAFAKSRSIVVLLDRSQTDGVRATILSGVEKENKQKIELSETSSILKEAQNWGSMVSVFILSESSIETRDYIILLDGMKENAFLQLASIEVSPDRKFSNMAESLMKQFNSEHWLKK